MHLENKNKQGFWIISEGMPVTLDLSNICKEAISGLITEYKISELARYLLNPNPITLEEKVVGCRVQYRKPSSGKLKRLLNKILPGTKSRSEGHDSHIEEIITASKLGAPSFKDENLNAHFIKINDLLKPYDPVQKKLSSLDREKVEDVKALCEDIGRNRYQLNLQGSIGDKINFVASSLSKKTKVVANKAYLLNGLFELRGFNFKGFYVKNSYRLIKFTQNNQLRYCVLNTNYQFEYWINENLLINYMHLMEQCIQSDPRLREALLLCVKGDAKPLKLFFAKQLGQDYSDKHLPTVYREVFSAHKISQYEKDTLAETLNKNQSIVSFTFVPLSGPEKHKLCTNISVMHDFRALEPIKGHLPKVYSEINKKALVSDAGKLYLMDSIRGYQNV
ncbi:MAG: hypothetical protein C4581_07200 [Nitrospiraceae bacterium]|nr:MAG: hypothetical protein C4581_07200 [Nitrospiraceae bacterium]